MKSKNGSKGGKMGGKKNTGYRNKGKTEVGKEAKVQSYKEYVQIGRASCRERVKIQVVAVSVKKKKKKTYTNHNE